MLRRVNPSSPSPIDAPGCLPGLARLVQRHGAKRGRQWTRGQAQLFLLSSSLVPALICVALLGLAARAFGFLGFLVVLALSVVALMAWLVASMLIYLRHCPPPTPQQREALVRRAQQRRARRSGTT
jgi:hypothetical protein